MSKHKLLIIHGTSREGNQTSLVSSIVLNIAASHPNFEATLIKPEELNLPNDGNGETAKDPHYSKLTKEADAFIIISPEYNHSFPGSLKRVLDSELENYKQKPVSLYGVSSGPFGGTRAIMALLPVVRELGLIAATSDVNFSSVRNLFDENGNLTEPKFEERINNSLAELAWMAKALKYGRDTLS